jgi:hypothetical protein
MPSRWYGHPDVAEVVAMSVPSKAVTSVIEAARSDASHPVGPTGRPHG